jgi:myosin heavy subunit
MATTESGKLFFEKLPNSMEKNDGNILDNTILCQSFCIAAASSESFSGGETFNFSKTEDELIKASDELIRTSEELLYKLDNITVYVAIGELNKEKLDEMHCCKRCGMPHDRSTYINILCWHKSGTIKEKRIREGLLEEIKKIEEKRNKFVLLVGQNLKAKTKLYEEELEKRKQEYKSAKQEHAERETATQKAKKEVKQASDVAEQELSNATSIQEELRIDVRIGHMLNEKPIEIAHRELLEESLVPYIVLTRATIEHVLCENNEESSNTNFAPKSSYINLAIDGSDADEKVAIMKERLKNAKEHLELAQENLKNDKKALEITNKKLLESKQEYNKMKSLAEASKSYYYYNSTEYTDKVKRLKDELRLIESDLAKIDEVYRKLQATNPEDVSTRYNSIDYDIDSLLNPKTKDAEEQSLLKLKLAGREQTLIQELEEQVRRSKEFYEKEFQKQAQIREQEEQARIREQEQARLSKEIQEFQEFQEKELQKQARIWEQEERDRRSKEIQEFQEFQEKELQKQARIREQEQARIREQELDEIYKLFLSDEDQEVVSNCANNITNNAEETIES